MPPVDNSRIKLIALAVLLILLIAGGIWYWRTRKALPPPSPPGLGQKIFDKVQNPLKDELPQTNPFKAKSNPFQKVETNPFQNTYKNPFQ